MKVLANMTDSVPTHGGKREGAGGAQPGSGRPRKDGPLTALQAANLQHAQERAAHEKVKREQREFDLLVTSNKYISRDAVRNASAMMCPTAAHHLLSIFDRLERDGVPLEIAQKVDDNIETALANLVEEMRLFTDEPLF